MSEKFSITVLTPSPFVRCPLCERRAYDTGDGEVVCLSSCDVYQVQPEVLFFSLAMEPLGLARFNPRTAPRHRWVSDR